uniref:RING-type domain-containing protein n=1 Tax=Macrostomum lignano TaxID=282301 RepID=A0A1I8F898_9PLAT
LRSNGPTFCTRAGARNGADGSQTAPPELQRISGLAPREGAKRWRRRDLAVEVARREAALGHLTSCQPDLRHLYQGSAVQENRRLGDAQSAAEQLCRIVRRRCESDPAAARPTNMRCAATMRAVKQQRRSAGADIGAARNMSGSRASSKTSWSTASGWRRPQCAEQRGQGAPGRGGAAVRSARSEQAAELQRRALAASQQENSLSSRPLGISAFEAEALRQGRTRGHRRSVRELTVSWRRRGLPPDRRPPQRSGPRGGGGDNGGAGGGGRLARQVRAESAARARRGSRGSPIEAAAAAAAEEAASESPRIEAELSAAGQQCRGERHADVIAHQKEALSELRRPIKEIERCEPRGQADQVSEKPDTPPTPAVTQPILDMERTAHRRLWTGRSQQPGPGPSPKAFASMAHLPRDRTAEAGKAKETKETPTATVQGAADTGRNELLSGCEQDMSRLKQAEELAQKRGVQLETLTEDCGPRTEETQLLRESLSRTKKTVLNGRRNGSTRPSSRRKTFHMEQRPEPAVGGEAAGRGPGSEQFEKKLRRKDYEIKTLKAELISKEKNLSSASERLANLSQRWGAGSSSDLDPFLPATCKRRACGAGICRENGASPTVHTRLACILCASFLLVDVGGL